MTESREFYYDSWIYQIVANKKNSIDVDKFDYICRDSYHIGLQSANVDYERIFSSARIINNNLCFNIKVKYILFRMNIIYFLSSKRGINYSNKSTCTRKTSLLI